MAEPVPAAAQPARPLWLRPLHAAGARQDRLGTGARWLAGSFVLGCLLRFIAMNGRDRILVMASQAFTAMIPLLIVLSSLSSDNDALADSLVIRFHLTGNGETAMRAL